MYCAAPSTLWCAGRRGEHMRDMSTKVVCDASPRGDKGERHERERRLGAALSADLGPRAELWHLRFSSAPQLVDSYTQPLGPCTAAGGVLRWRAARSGYAFFSERTSSSSSSSSSSGMAGSARPTSRLCLRWTAHAQICTTRQLGNSFPICETIFFACTRGRREKRDQERLRLRSHLLQWWACA